MKSLLKLNRRLTLFYFTLRYKDLKLARLLNRNKVGIQEISYLKRNGNELEFTRTGNKILIEKTFIFRRHFRSLLLLLNDQRVEVVPANKPFGIRIRVCDTMLNLGSDSNVFAAYEVYLQRLYNITLPDHDNVIVDIGMNVGFATLFFAALDQVSQVYAYEPFPETFKEAAANVELNPHLKQKIRMFNYGVSNLSRVLDVPLYDSGSLGASTSSFILDAKKKPSSGKSTNVVVRDVVEILNEVRETHPHQNLFLKVDCEGEEYSIMERLDVVGMVTHITGYFIEWHTRGAAPIIHILSHHGFAVLHLPRINGSSGMLYAFQPYGKLQGIKER